MSCSTATTVLLVLASLPARAASDLAATAAVALAAHTDDHLIEVGEPLVTIAHQELKADAGFARARPELFATVNVPTADRERFGCLLRIQLIDSWLAAHNRDAARHWRPYLVELRGSLPATGCDARVDAIFDQATVAYAHAKKARIASEQLRGTLVSVSFQGRPATERMYLVDEIVYRIYSREGKDVPADQWRPVGGPPQDLFVGDYRVKASWDGKTWSVQPCEVRRSGQTCVLRGISP